MDDREWIARQFEAMLAPDKLDEALVAKAYAFFNERLLEYGTSESVEGQMSTDADAVLQLQSSLKRATARAASETAAALRSRKL